MRTQKMKDFCFLDHIHLGLYLKDMAVIVIFLKFSEFFLEHPLEKFVFSKARYEHIVNFGAQNMKG